MKIDLSPAHRQQLLECIRLGEREELNGIDYSGENPFAFEDEEEIKSKYDRLRRLLMVGKTRVNEPI